MLTPANANAAAITNLTDTPQEIAVVDTHKIVTIAPGRTYTISGTVVIGYGGKKFRMDDQEEWAIWKGNKLMLQKREHLKHN